MKRVPSKVAVASILMTMPAEKIVKVVDVDRSMFCDDEPWDSANSSFGLTYTVDEILHDYNNTRIAKAEVHRVAVNEGMLLLVIDTAHETY